MNLRHSKLQQQEQSQAAAQEQIAKEQTAREFSTPEELLRHDAAQMQVPPTVAERLNRSIARAGIQPAPSWWKRWLNP